MIIKDAICCLITQPFILNLAWSYAFLYLNRLPSIFTFWPTNFNLKKRLRILILILTCSCWRNLFLFLYYLRFFIFCCCSCCRFFANVTFFLAFFFEIFVLFFHILIGVFVLRLFSITNILPITVNNCNILSCVEI